MSFTVPDGTSNTHVVSEILQGRPTTSAARSGSTIQARILTRRGSSIPMTWVQLGLINGGEMIGSHQY